MIKLPNKRITPEMMAEHIAFWQAMQDAWDRCDILPDDDLTTIVFKTYFRVQNVTDMFHQFKAEGIGDFKNTTSISDLIRFGSIADKQLEQLTKAIQDKNFKLSQLIPNRA